MRKIIALLLAASMLLTAGCSKKVEEIKTVDETQTDAAQPVEKQDDLAEFRDAGVWNDDMQGTIGGEKVDVSIFAHTELPEYTQSVVVEGKTFQFDEEYKKSVLKGIFGEEDIYYHDLKHQTTEELQIQLDELEKETILVGVGETMHEERDEEGIKKLQEYLAKSKSEYTTATDFRVDEYIAKRNGEWYTVIFDNRETANSHSAIYFHAEKRKGPEVWKDAAGVSYSALESGDWENTCKFSPKEAEKEVLFFAERIGINNLVSRPAIHMECRPYDETKEYLDELVYGYTIDFWGGVNGECMFGNVFGIQMQTCEEEGVGYAKVTDEGVVDFVIHDPMEQTRVSEHVKLLSLDKIRAAFKNEIVQNLELYVVSFANREDYKKMKFDTIKLLYMWLIKDSSTGEGAYLPVWVLMDTSMGSYAKIYVNAIDGTVLDKENLR